jgi:hypothetical protein
MKKVFILAGKYNIKEKDEIIADSEAVSIQWTKREKNFKIRWKQPKSG